MMKLAKTLALTIFFVFGHGPASGVFFDSTTIINNNINNANTNIAGNGNMSFANSGKSGKFDLLREPLANSTNSIQPLSSPTKSSLSRLINSPSSFDKDVEIENLRKLENPKDGSPDALKAFRGYKALAKEGNLQGHIEVGRLLFDLNNPDADIEAYEQFSIAARKGYAEGIAWQAWMHEARRAPNSNFKTALNLYKSAAQKGNAWAMYKLGVAYETAGLGIHQDIRIAIDWYWKAARLYFGPAVVQLAWLFDHGEVSYRDRIKALKLFELGARLNQPAALFNLGLKYANGDGVVNDFSLAAKYYERAANLGDYASQNNLGNLYLDGKGVVANSDTAVSWYRKSALQGNNNALFNLGNSYRTGNGVPKNPETAVYWYKRAADNGYAIAQFNLGLMYQSGEGVSKNVETAISWFKKSAERNYADSIYQLAFLYANGSDVKQDFVEAAKWLRLGAKQGNAAAMNDLAVFIEQKKIEPQLGEDTLSLYKRAADAGNPTGMVNYGRKLEFGFGVDADIPRAITLLEKGRNAKVLDANVLLADIYINPPKGVDRDLSKAFRYLFDAAPENDEAALRMVGLAFLNPELFSAKDRDKVVVFLERVAKSINTENSESAKLILGHMLVQEQWKLNNPNMALTWLSELSDSGNADATAYLLLFYFSQNENNPSVLTSIFKSEKGIALINKVARQPGVYKPFAEMALEALQMGPERANLNYFYQWIEKAAVAGDSTMMVMWANHLSESSPEKAAELLRAQVSSGENVMAKMQLCKLLKTYHVLPASAEELKTCF